MMAEYTSREPRCEVLWPLSSKVNGGAAAARPPCCGPMREWVAAFLSGTDRNAQAVIRVVPQETR